MHLFTKINNYVIANIKYYPAFNKQGFLYFQKKLKVNNIEVCLSPKLFDFYSFKKKIVVVVDILRATSIITTMIENGAEKIIPVENLDQAREYKKKGFLIAAERNGKKVDFADFDNSPFSFTNSKVQGKTIVYSTTNGTNTINRAKNSDILIMASFLNLSAIVNYLINQGLDILILCSGWKGNYCIEDSLFAGVLTSKLVKTKKFKVQDDSALASMDLWNQAKIDLSKYIQNIHQYKRLKKMGFERILDYCFQIDLSNVIPIFKEDCIINLAKL